MTTVDYTVVVGDTECTIVELSETASLADARTEVELDAIDIQAIPRDFLFLYKGTLCSRRKEETRKVADAPTGAEARLHIVAVAAVPVAAGSVAIAPVAQDAAGGAAVAGGRWCLCWRWRRCCCCCCCCWRR